MYACCLDVSYQLEELSSKYKRITHRQPLITLSMSGEGELKKKL